METSLHRALKEHFRRDGGVLEGRLESFRIDVINPDELVEIQHAGLGQLRDKLRRLLLRHDVLVVKPLIHRKQIVRHKKKGGQVASRRWSPKRGDILEIFDDLVHFVQVFPHPRLALEVPLVDVEEARYPGHGRRRRWRAKDHCVADQSLLAMHETYRFETAHDLLSLFPNDVDTPFHTGQLAERLEIPRWRAQKIAYCLLKTGAARAVGRTRAGRWYEFEAA